VPLDARGARRDRLLLDRVREFVREKALAGRAVGPIFSSTEEDVVTDGERARAARESSSAGLRTGVHAHAAEVVAEAWLERRAHRRGERLPLPQRGHRCDARLDTARDDVRTDGEHRVLLSDLFL